MSGLYKYVKKSIQKRSEWLNTLKSGPCRDCKIDYPPYVKDWHHLDPTTKSFGLGRGRFRNSREKILEEIAKCILLCANCHRIREYGKKNSIAG
jgi:hypothetical protein